MISTGICVDTYDTITCNTVGVMNHEEQTKMISTLTTDRPIEQGHKQKTHEKTQERYWDVEQNENPFLCINKQNEKVSCDDVIVGYYHPHPSVLWILYKHVVHQWDYLDFQLWTLR